MAQLGRRNGLAFLAKASALLAIAALGFAPSAFATGDPIASGSVKLATSGAFKSQLTRNHLWMRSAPFALRGGSIDPTTGAGSLKLSGRLVFRHGMDKVVFRALKVQVGPGGVMTGRLGHKRVRLFALRGGVAARSGFGFDMHGVGVTLLSGAARKLRRSLDLDNLHRGAAGTASVSEQPKTVEILGGTATVTPALGAGSISAKLAAHCIDPSAGVSAVAPGMQPGGPETAFIFPVTFGTISPTGAAGVIQQAGGIQLSDGGSGLPSGCPASSTVTTQIGDLAADLEQATISAHTTIRGPGSPFGDLDAVTNFPIDASGTQIDADPAGLVVATYGTRIELNYLAATMLNTIFPQPGPADPSMDFAAGDDFGTAALSVQVR